MATSNVDAPKTYAQLQAQARAAVEAELAQANNPIKGQIRSLTTKQHNAAGDISQEFQGLMPYVQGSANNVENSYADSMAMEQEIFQAAGQRMNNVKQQAAAEGQQLAQQMGGPVAIGEFTAGLDPYAKQQPAQEGGNMLHALGLAAAGTQEAEAFAGKVFPALQTEQTAKSNSFFQDQTKALQDQINQNNASKSKLTNQTLQQMVAQERAYDLELNRFGLQKNEVRFNEQAKLTELQQTAERIGISQQRLAFDEQKAAVSEQQRQQQLNTSATKNATSILDAAMGTGKPVTLSVMTYIPKNSPEVRKAALGNSSFYHYDKKKGQWYYFQRETLTPQQWNKQGYGSNISDPQDLYNLVRGAVPGLSKQAVIGLVRGKTGMKNWVPGQVTSYTGQELHGMPLKELDGIARDRGFKGNYKDRQAVVDFILGSG